MGRTTRGGSRNHTPNVRPVQKVELSDKNTKQRFVAVIVCLLVASAAFIYALNGLMSNDSGWTGVEASSSAETNCGDDFIFQYYIGAAGVDATAERKALTLLYTDIMVKAYELFHNDESFEGVTNVYEINQHPNETLEVDPVLYDAFEKIAESGRRELYLAPVYLEYKNLFFCNDDSETVNYDAVQNPEVAQYFKEVADFAGNPEMVDMKLLGNNQVMLYVSEEYLAYAEENYIEDYIDFSWMQNAFIIDYAAEELAAKGYTLGYLTSYDGFTRNLDSSSAGSGVADSSSTGSDAGNDTADGSSGDRTYSFNIYDREENTIYPAGVMNYSGAISIVRLHNYVMSDKDDHYYEFQNGDTRTSYISIEDGLCRSAVNDMITYSKEAGCAEVLLETIPVYITDSLDTEAVKEIAAQDVDAIYCDNHTVYYTDNNIDISDLYDKDGIAYTKELMD